VTRNTYHGYDLKALDWQYNPSQGIPDYARFLEAYLEDSKRATDSLRCDLDVPYGPGPHETLDIFPAARPHAPVMVFFHGGYWQELYTDSWRFLAPAFVAAGVTYVAVNYALAPSVTLDEIVRQSRAALAWLVEHAADYGADPTRIHVSGHSAGGHLTAMLLATDWPAFRSGMPAQPIAGACAVSGVYDLEPIMLTSVNDALGLDASAARRNSPLFFIPERAPELVLCVGGLESAEFHRQQDDFLARWRMAGLPARVVPMPGYHHFDVIQQLGSPSSPLFAAIMGQIGESGGEGAEK
jgi:arylformamidase